VILIVLLTRVAAKIKRDGMAKGGFANAIESVVVFIRDEVAEPAIGHHDAHRFMPFLLTMFFFILACNLLGLVPWAGSATGALATTGTLALITFGTVVATGMSKLGVAGFVKSLVPHMDLPLPLKIALVIIMFPIEVLGLLIKHCHASAGEHDGRAPGARGDLGIYRRQCHQRGLVGGHSGKHRRLGGPQFTGTVRRLFAGIHFYVFVGVVHRHGGTPALVKLSINLTSRSRRPNQ
jgi:hypothetical protein